MLIEEQWKDSYSDVHLLVSTYNDIDIIYVFILINVRK